MCHVSMFCYIVDNRKAAQVVWPFCVPPVCPFVPSKLATQTGQAFKVHMVVMFLIANVAPVAIFKSQASLNSKVHICVTDQQVDMKLKFRGGPHIVS